VSLVVVGEALVDVLTRADGSVDERPGGSPANVAFALHRLGRPVSFVTCLGDDDRGRMLRKHLEGVTLLSDPIDETSTAVARIDTDGMAHYAFRFTWRRSEPTPEATWLHVGSLAAAVDDGMAECVARLAASTRVSYDPNLRPSHFDDKVRDRALILAGRADVVKLSEEDAALLLPGTDPVSVAREILALGPRVVVVTLGAAGAVAVMAPSSEVLRVRAGQGAAVVDTVGAGDAFMAGLVDALHDTDLDSQAVARALDRGTAVARRSCERPGADPPWEWELR